MNNNEIAGYFPVIPTTYQRPWITPTELPTGEWNMLANGRLFTMDITAVSGNRFRANFTSGDIIDAGWNPDTGEIRFRRFIEGQLDQAYTGYLLHYSETDPLWRVVGTFYQDNLKATSGWYMTQPK